MQMITLKALTHARRTRKAKDIIKVAVREVILVENFDGSVAVRFERSRPKPAAVGVFTFFYVYSLQKSHKRSEIENFACGP